MKYYHATVSNNAKSIINDGKIYTGIDGIVYLADSRENALNFVAVRGFNEPIIVFEIDIPEDESKFVEETFDHSHNFFRCKSYGYPKNIPADWIADVYQWHHKL